MTVHVTTVGFPVWDTGEGAQCGVHGQPSARRGTDRSAVRKATESVAGILPDHVRQERCK
jgi:hypothetical protein